MPSSCQASDSHYSHRYTHAHTHMQGGLTWLWLDAPYVITARKLFNWAVEANNNGDVFPVRFMLVFD